MAKQELQNELRRTTERLNKLESLLEKWLLESTQRPNPTYSELIHNNQKKLDCLDSKVTELIQSFADHNDKYKALNEFLDKAMNAREAFYWIGGGTFVLMKYTVYAAATIAAFVFTIKGWWAAAIAVLIEPFLNR